MGTHYYEIDAGITYAGGQQVADLDGDVNEAKSTLVTALDAVTPGSRHQVGDVDTGIETFKTWAIESANSVASGVSNLGNNTAEGASTSVDTTSTVTTLYNGQTSLNRGINVSAPTMV